MAGTGVEELLRTGVLPARDPTRFCRPLGTALHFVSDMDGSQGGCHRWGRGYTAVSTQPLGVGWGWWHQAAACAKAPGALVDLSAVTQLSEKQMQHTVLVEAEWPISGGSRLRPYRLCRLLAELGTSVPALVNRRGALHLSSRASTLRPESL